MKRILSYIMLFVLVLQIFAVNVVALDSPICVEIKGAQSASTADNEGEVEIKITSTANKDLLIKILDVKDNKVIYLDVVPEGENNTVPEGTDTAVKITDIVLKKKDIGFNEYKLIVSESSAVKEKTFTVTKYEGSDGHSTVIKGDPPSKDEPGWIDKPKPDDPTPPGDNPPQIEPLNEKAIQGAAKQETAKEGAAYIKATTAGTAPEAMAWESTRNTIAVSVETMMANIASKSVNISRTNNQLILQESSISISDANKYADTEKTLDKALKDNKIDLNRTLTKEYIIHTNFNTSKKAVITVHKGFVDKLETMGIEVLTIDNSNFRISYSIAELKEMLGEKESASFEIDTSKMASSAKKLTVNFDTNKVQSVKISFPGLSGDTKYMAIVDENGNPVGGRYNPATGAIEAKISESGVYQVKNNEKDFEDIKNLSEEMQESIKILAAKGIIEGTSEKEFSPADSISRAEVAALLLRLLSQVDPNADGGFADVKKSDWFFGTAGSAKAYGMIVGFEDNTFRGNDTIAKDQILTISSRVLQKEMKYIVPTQPKDWITFADASSVAAWAEQDIALATMANIITRTSDNTIHANENMTRGDAALIIMRLFYKIW